MSEWRGRETGPSFASGVRYSFPVENVNEPVRFTDLFRPSEERASRTARRDRLALCEQCEHFLATKQCGKCGCFMPLKVTLARAECPIGLWNAEVRQPRTSE